MDAAFVVGGCVLFVAYSIALVVLGMGISARFNAQAWNKYYEGRDGR